VGQTGRVCRRWCQRGVRPRGRRDFRHEAVWLRGAVCPARDTGVALVLPRSDTGAMQLLLDELAKAVEPGAHAVVLLDRAGWHTTENLVMADNLTLALLPSYSPESNAIERLWLYLRERFLSHGVWPACQDIVDACCRAWNAVRAEDGRIRSLCSLDWAQSIRI
jgi:hypothetical protein